MLKKRAIIWLLFVFFGILMSIQVTSGVNAQGKCANYERAVKWGYTIEFDKQYENGMQYYPDSVCTTLSPCVYEIYDAYIFKPGGFEAQIKIDVMNREWGIKEDASFLNTNDAFCGHYKVTTAWKKSFDPTSPWKPTGVIISIYPVEGETCLPEKETDGKKVNMPDVSDGGLPQQYLDSFRGEIDFDTFWNIVLSDSFDKSSWKWNNACAKKDKCADKGDNDGYEDLTQALPYGLYKQKLAVYKNGEAIQQSAFDVRFKDNDDPDCKFSVSFDSYKYYDVLDILNDEKEFKPGSELKWPDDYKFKYDDYKKRPYSLGSDNKPLPYCYDNDGDGFCGVPTLLTDGVTINSDGSVNIVQFKEDTEKSKLYEKSPQFPDCDEKIESGNKYLDAKGNKIAASLNYHVKDTGDALYDFYSAFHVHPFSPVTSINCKFMYYDFNCNKDYPLGDDTSLLQKEDTPFDLDLTTGVELEKIPSKALGGYAGVLFLGNTKADPVCYLEDVFGEITNDLAFQAVAAGVMIVAGVGVTAVCPTCGVLLYIGGTGLSTYQFSVGLKNGDLGEILGGGGGLLLSAVGYPKLAMDLVQAGYVKADGKTVRVALLFEKMLSDFSGRTWYGRQIKTSLSRADSAEQAISDLVAGKIALGEIEAKSSAGYLIENWFFNAIRKYETELSEFLKPLVTAYPKDFEGTVNVGLKAIPRDVLLNRVKEFLDMKGVLYRTRYDFKTKEVEIIIRPDSTTVLGRMAKIVEGTEVSGQRGQMNVNLEQALLGGAYSPNRNTIYLGVYAIASPSLLRSSLSLVLLHERKHQLFMTYLAKSKGMFLQSGLKGYNTASVLEGSYDTYASADEMITFLYDIIDNVNKISKMRIKLSSGLKVSTAEMEQFFDYVTEDVLSTIAPKSSLDFLKALNEQSVIGYTDIADSLDEMMAVADDARIALSGKNEIRIAFEGIGVPEPGFPVMEEDIGFIYIYRHSVSVEGDIVPFIEVTVVPNREAIYTGKGTVKKEAVFRFRDPEMIQQYNDIMSRTKPVESLSIEALKGKLDSRLKELTDFAEGQNLELEKMEGKLEAAARALYVLKTNPHDAQQRKIAVKNIKAAEEIFVKLFRESTKKAVQ